VPPLDFRHFGSEAYLYCLEKAVPLFPMRRRRVFQYCVPHQNKPAIIAPEPATTDNGVLMRMTSAAVATANPKSALPPKGRVSLDQLKLKMRNLNLT
jgi:hypothetical protein